MLTGSVVCGDVTSSGTVSAPQLFASNITVTNTSDFSDDLFLTKNWAGWSRLAVGGRAAAAGQPERAGLPGAGRWDAPVRAHHDQRRGAGADQEPLHAAVPDHEPEEPGCLANTGNVVCNTSFTNLSDSRVKEMAEADVAELKQLFVSVEAKQYKRPDMNGDLRLGFALDDFAGTKWKNLTGPSPARPPWNLCRTRTPRRWAGPVVRHAGPGAACGSRGPQRHCRGGPGHPDAEEGPGHEGGAQGRAVERGATALSGRPGPTTRGPTRRCTARPRTWSAEAGAAGAAGQRRLTTRGRPGEAAGRLPEASEAQDPQLASFVQASPFPRKLDRTPFGAKRG